MTDEEDPKRKEVTEMCKGPSSEQPTRVVGRKTSASPPSSFPDWPTVPRTDRSPGLPQEWADQVGPPSIEGPTAQDNRAPKSMQVQVAAAMAAPPVLPAVIASSVAAPQPPATGAQPLHPASFEGPTEGPAAGPAQSVDLGSMRPGDSWFIKPEAQTELHQPPMPELVPDMGLWVQIRWYVLFAAMGVVVGLMIGYSTGYRKGWNEAGGMAAASLSIPANAPAVPPIVPAADPVPDAPAPAAQPATVASEAATPEIAAPSPRPVAPARVRPVSRSAPTRAAAEPEPPCKGKTQQGMLECCVGQARARAQKVAESESRELLSPLYREPTYAAELSRCSTAPETYIPK